MVEYPLAFGDLILGSEALAEKYLNVLSLPHNAQSPRELLIIGQILSDLFLHVFEKVLPAALN
jgi:hypothetical protein